MITTCRLSAIHFRLKYKLYLFSHKPPPDSVQRSQKLALEENLVYSQQFTSNYFKY